MSSNINLNLKLAGDGIAYGVAGLTTPSEPIVIGQGNWPEMALKLVYGTLAGQVKQVWQAQRVLAAAANDDLDFNGSLTNGLGESIVLTAIKVLLIAIDVPDGIKKLRVGPQGLAQSFQGPWGGVTATDYHEVTDWNALINNPWTGYPIVAGASDKLRINNPSAVSVTYRILAAGVTP